MVEIVFGPVPSRRLGKSLGINNIPPPKRCSYSCIYCQLGATKVLTIERRRFYDTEILRRELSEKLSEIDEDELDYITFVPDGEPTLDESLSKHVEAVKELSDKPIAILTNSTLISNEDVKRDLMRFDLVSIKLDAASEGVWKRINRPHPSLSLREILDGMRVFRRDFPGKLISETMLIDGVNSERSEIERIADELSRIEPDKAYIAIPTRPPAESWVKPADEEKLVESYEIFSESLGRDRVELLIGYEGAGFRIGGDFIKDLLSIASIHPIRLDYVHQMLSKFVHNPDELIERLIDLGEIRLIEYRGRAFLVRRREIRED
ncbi:MAG: radical SAM protein [Candidatus Wolframiiraptor sp. EX4484-121]|nr:MAG: radical SAM protein [Candidatus Wolframiiraptor sp. EX4484-121]